MKKSELKALIKECIKESIFEDGVLSGIITEVAAGMSNQRINSAPAQTEHATAMSKSAAEALSLLEGTRKSVISAITENSYEDIKNKFQNPEFFEGTTPLTEGASNGPLSQVSAQDPGVNIQDIPGFGSWGKVATTKSRK